MGVEGVVVNSVRKDLFGRLGGPQSLKELGFKRELLEKAADLASKASYPNSAPLEKSPSC
jgi:maleylacetate reductase